MAGNQGHGNRPSKVSKQGDAEACGEVLVIMVVYDSSFQKSDTTGHVES